MKKQVVVLGAGFGGLELVSRLSESVPDEVEITLIDKSDAFMFGFSKLDVMFGHALPSSVPHPYRDVVKPGVHFVQATVRSIDPVSKRVETDAGTFGADVLVVDIEAMEIFGDEQISCNDPNCGWHGKASKTKLLRILQFYWLFSPTT